MRLWDLGQQRCVQTLAVHTDSVWALAATPSFAAVFSGGRDGCIYRWVHADVCVCVCVCGGGGECGGAAGGCASGDAGHPVSA
jgi:WD40 repeat protein